jgi:putative hydrolase of the HAD superfamily
VKPIHAIVFDWGGVFQRTEDPAPRRQLEAELGLPAGGVERAVFQHPLWDMASTGQCSVDEAWNAIVSDLGLPTRSVDEFVQRFFAGDCVDGDLVALVHALRARGQRVALLSNAPPGRSSATASARWGQEGLFDAQVFSYQVGVLKPHPRMYAAAVAALGMAPEEMLFVDDAPANVQGACAAGMHGVLFVGLDALRYTLQSHGIG